MLILELQKLLPQTGVDKNLKLERASCSKNSSKAAKTEDVEIIEKEKVPEFDINVFFDCRLLDKLNTVQLITLLLQESPCDNTIDTLIEALINADAVGKHLLIFFWYFSVSEKVKKNFSYRR